MKCPQDNATLLITERSGIEIDYCPECRGVWLDRGELDKLIERTNSHSETPSRRHDDDDDDRHRREHDEHRREEHRDDYHHSDNHDKHNGQHKKREGFLGDFFDF